MKLKTLAAAALVAAAFIVGGAEDRAEAKTGTVEMHYMLKVRFHL